MFPHFQNRQEPGREVDDPLPEDLLLRGNDPDLLALQRHVPPLKG
jgi:hypothetical protein